MDDIGRTFSENLKELRALHGWSREFLAERANLSAGAIVGLEYNERWPEKTTVAALAKALGVTQERLFSPLTGRSPMSSAEALRVLAEKEGFEIKPIKPRNRKPSK